MKKIVILWTFSLILISESYSQDKITNLKLKTDIDSLYTIDQRVQADMVAAYQRGISIDSDSMKYYELTKNETFKRHISIVKQIISQHGFPTADVVGKKSLHRFFLLIQHSDADITFQKKMLPEIKNLVDLKQLSSGTYAFLYDRVYINLGKKQLYGTQLDYDKNGVAFPKNIKNIKKVNKRRLELGMELIEIYLQKATKLHKEQNLKD